MIGQPGFVVAGKFRLEKLIGEGGMGQVWRAWDQSLERTVAVKFISDEAAASDSARQRFFAEAKAAAGLRTPHVVQIIEQGVEAETPFIVMELLEGEDLHQRMKRRKKLTPPEVCEIVRQLARGLRVAHDAGVIHRDLKPANVFLARVDDDAETAKILDFGIAKLQRPGAIDHLTATNELVGSVYYMSPEQIRGRKDYDHRVDLWALGIMVFRTLTGKLPFRGDNVGAVAVEICTAAIPKALELVPTLPEGIDEFFAQALCRDPDARFASARALSRALDAVCLEEESPHSEPYLSTPPSGEPVPVIELSPEPPSSEDEIVSAAPPSRRRRAGLASRLVLSSAPPESSAPPPSSDAPPSSVGSPSSSRTPVTQPTPVSFRPSPSGRNRLSDPAPPSSRRRAAMAKRMVPSAPPSDPAASAPTPSLDLDRPTSSPRPAYVAAPRDDSDDSAPVATLLRDSGAVVGMALLATIVGMAASGVAGRPSLLVVVGFALGGAGALVSVARLWGHRSHATLTVAALALVGVGGGALGMAAAGLVPGLATMVPALGMATRLCAAVVCVAFSAYGLLGGRERMDRGDKGAALALAVLGLFGLAVAAQLVRGAF